MPELTDDGGARAAWIMTRVGSRRAAVPALVGGAAGVAAALAGARIALANQTVDWRFCHKCRGLWWELDGGNVCPAGGAHSKRRSLDFALVYDVSPTANDESGWRQCQSCSAACWAGAVGASIPFGACPANASGHVYTDTRNYLLEYNVPPSSTEQGGWRFCSKCNGLFHPKGRKRGVCPAGGKHQIYAGYTYNLAIWAP